MSRVNYIPAIEVESSNGTREVCLSTRHLMNRRLFITGEINADLANDFLSEFLYLEQDGDDPVTIYVNSPGGEISAGLMIYDIIQASSMEINIICTGMAASMAALLVAGGQKGRRFILPHSKMMIHEPLIGSGVGGSATSIRNISESILKTRTITNGILAKHTGKTVEEIDQATSFDNYMDAAQAVEFGLCDTITDNIVI